MKEIFKDIPEYESLYQVSNLGNIKSLPKLNGVRKSESKILKGGNDKNGYKIFILCKNNNRKTIKLHRIVIETFKGKSNLPVNHIDGNKQNNNIKNLEYTTILENNRHAWKLGLCNMNHRKKKVKCNELNKIFNSATEASKELNINRGHLCEVARGERKFVSGFSFIYI